MQFILADKSPLDYICSVVIKTNNGARSTKGNSKEQWKYVTVVLWYRCNSSVLSRVPVVACQKLSDLLINQL